MLPTMEKAKELCDCGKCEMADKCNYKDKYRRLPRELYRGALGLCPRKILRSVDKWRK